MVTHFINHLTKVQFTILIVVIVLLGYFGLEYLAISDSGKPHSTLPSVVIAIVLFSTPLLIIRKKGRPEEFQSYSIKRRLITITALLIFSTIAFTVVDYILFYLVK